MAISYELASLRDRVLALLIDWMAIGLACAIIAWITSMFSIFSSGDSFLVLILLLIVPIIVFYVPTMEILNNGQTLGKMALRIKVVKLDGRQLNFFDYLLRWAFRLIDIFFSCGSIAAILTTSTDHGQRLGGLVSNSTVVRLNPSLYVSLQDILKINTRDNYEPQYPEIRNFREEDLLLIKQTVDRFRKFKNDAHKEALLALCENLKDRLGLDELPKDRISFLKTVIKDYIVLTR